MRRRTLTGLAVVVLAGCGGSERAQHAARCDGVQRTGRRPQATVSITGTLDRAEARGRFPTARDVCAWWGEPAQVQAQGDGGERWSYGDGRRAELRAGRLVDADDGGPPADRTPIGG